MDNKCGNCKYWVKDAGDNIKGTCHRYPMYMAGYKSDVTKEYNRVKIYSFDWCGEFVNAKENETQRKST